MIKRFKSFFSAEHGASPWIAVFAMTVLLAFTALVVDLGLAYLETSKLQSALDAGALAGASFLPDTAAATTAAIECVELNGFTASDVTVSFSGSNAKISLSSDREVETLFLSVLGKDEWNINRKAAAAKTGGSGGGVFDYRIFVGDPSYRYTMGGKFTVNGSVHCNGGFYSYPNQAGGRITGTLETGSKPDVNKNFTAGNKVWPTQQMGMPDFTEAVNNIMPAQYDSYIKASVINNDTSGNRQTWNGSKYITGNVTVSNGVDIYDDVYIDGNLTITGGGPFKIYGNLYVSGSIYFGNTVYVEGSIMAGKTINFTGWDNRFAADSTVCIYSATGDIHLTTASTTATGIVYAPKGTVYLAGGTLTFYGSIVGLKVSGVPDTLIMGEPSQPIDFLPGGDPTIKLVE